MSWSRDLVLFFLQLLLFSTLVSTQPPSCVQYYLPESSSPAPSLQCSSHLTSCHYVTTPTSLSLSEAEAQLGDLLSQLLPALTRGELQEECLDAFVALYCYQSYTVCGQLVGGVYEATGGVVCAEDCVYVVNDVCGQEAWSSLTNIVQQLLDNSIVMLPPLVQLDACNVNSSSSQDCVAIINNNTTPREDCTPTPPPTSPTTNTPSSSLSTGAIAGICVAAGFTLIVTTLLLALILYLLRRQRRPKHLSRPSTAGSSEVSGAPTVPTNQPRLDLAQELSSENPHQSSGTLMLRASTVHEALLGTNLANRTTTFAKRIKDGAFLNLSPKQRLQQLEFPRGNICLVRDLWETNFGPVHMGEASGLDQNNELTSVFIKSLRNTTNAKLRQQFRIEMTWASGFSHPNIISLLGVCLKEEPHYILYEYLEYGSLKEFLQSVSSMWFDFDRFLDTTEMGEGLEEGPNLSVFGVEDLTSMACQVADGMDYLAKKAFVLKDLAARNCQVGQNLVIKIANFGLSYDRCSEDYCCIRSHKNTPVPLRWLAPETIRHNKVSVYSDVWSFGVLLWEIFSFGARPYAELSNAAVVESVLSGCVLPRPDRCPQGVYSLMLKCWNINPSKRPWFHALRPELADVPKGMDTEERKSFGGAPPTPEIERALRIR